MKDIIISKINDIINSISSEKLENEDKLEYLNKHTISYQYLTELDFSDLLKIFFLTLSNIDYDYLFEATDYLNEELEKLNEITVTPFADLLDDLLFYVDNHRFEELYVDNYNDFLNLNINDS